MSGFIICDKDYREIAELKSVLSAEHTDKLNGENFLNFSAVLDMHSQTLITEEKVIKYKDTYTINIYRWEEDALTFLRTYSMSRPSGRTTTIHDCIFSPDGNYLVVGTYSDLRAFRWNDGDITPISILEKTNDSYPELLSFSDDGLLAVNRRLSITFHRIYGDIMEYAHDVEERIDYKSPVLLNQHRYRLTVGI